LLLGGQLPFAVGQFERLGLASQVMISLGAGLYEELLFRVVLVGALAGLGRRLLGSPAAAGSIAVILGALIFSAFHYVGPHGDRLELGSFAFRAVAGLLFSTLYLLRGFGITAWTHALYDLMLVG
jgi:membrane protease YdiL (CAAX protease family)